MVVFLNLFLIHVELLIIFILPLLLDYFEYFDQPNKSNDPNYPTSLCTYPTSPTGPSYTGTLAHWWPSSQSNGITHPGQIQNQSNCRNTVQPEKEGIEVPFHDHYRQEYFSYEYTHTYYKYSIEYIISWFASQ